MNRRSFLGLLGGLCAASATSYFFAPIGGWKSDVISHAPMPAWAVISVWPRPWFEHEDIQQRMNRSMNILNTHFAEMKGAYAPRGNGYPEGIGSSHT